MSPCRHNILITLISLLRISARELLDFSLVCNPGYRVSGIERTEQHGQFAGALTIYCEAIELDHRQVQCARLQNVPQCSGVTEGCVGQSWLSGFHLYVVENITKAVLLDPICCSSRNTKIDEDSCIRDRLNQPSLRFEHGIAGDLVYRGMQCWHQYNTDNVLFDLIWKMEICPFMSPLKQSHRSPACPSCECDCGPGKCSNGNHPARLVHKQYDPRMCECRCSCDHYCIDS